MFAQLVDDTDRNLGNVLITPEWKLIMIDFTRAFRLAAVIKPEEISRCERHLFDALEHLQLDALTHATTGYLTADEAKAVIARRDLIVTHVRKLIADKGEAAVTVPSPTSLVPSPTSLVPSPTSRFHHPGFRVPDPAEGPYGPASC